MSEEIIKIEEIKKGTRGGRYVYVVEGNKLIHINEYAIRIYEYRDILIYEVPKNKLMEKTIYCFGFLRSGNAFLIKCKIDDFEDGYPKNYEYFSMLKDKLHELQNLEYHIKDSKLISLLIQFEQLFIPMIKEIKVYEKVMNFEIRFMGRQRRLEEAFRDFKSYYYTFMSLPKDTSRIKSLKVIRRWIYQLWILKLLCEAIEVYKFKEHKSDRSSFWWIEQGSDVSTCVAESSYGDITFWLEFQPNKIAHMIGIFSEKRIPIRPDIVIAKGYFKRTEDFINSGNSIDIIIECKEDPFDAWKKEIETQIFPYIELFKPRKFIIASLEPVPEATKEHLKAYGIEIIDNLKPKSKNIEVLYSTIRKILK